MKKFLMAAVGAAALMATAPASAVPIDVVFNFVPFGTFYATPGGSPGSPGDVTIATAINGGGPYQVTTILNNNVGLVSTQAVTLSDPVPTVLGGQFTKEFTTALGTFTESLTVNLVTIGASSIAITAAGTISCTSGTCLDVGNNPFDATNVFFSASWTQNGGVGAQINGSFNDSTVPPPPRDIPEPATLALLGAALAGLGLARRRRA